MKFYVRHCWHNIAIFLLDEDEIIFVEHLTGGAPIFTEIIDKVIVPTSDQRRHNIQYVHGAKLLGREAELSSEQLITEDNIAEVSL